MAYNDMEVIAYSYMETFATETWMSPFFIAAERCAAKITAY